MDPLHFCIMIAPLGVYFLLIGLISLRRRPFVTTGARDAAAIGIAISGLMIAGPMELFFPESAAGRFGSYVWLLLIAFYGLCVSLIVLLMRPRLVVYNLSPQRLRPIIADIAIRLDPKSRWSGDSLHMPSMDVQLHLEGSSWMSNSQLVAVGDNQRFESWRKLERELREQLGDIRAESVVFGVTLVSAASVMAGAAIFWMVSQPQAVRDALADMLRF
ncbi:MAG: hypothetical protein ACR2NP_10835 [Pirellulaceae bacterium]